MANAPAIHTQHTHTYTALAQPSTSLRCCSRAFVSSGFFHFCVSSLSPRRNTLYRSFPLAQCSTLCARHLRLHCFYLCLKRCSRREPFCRWKWARKVMKTINKFRRTKWSWVFEAGIWYPTHPRFRVNITISHFRIRFLIFFSRFADGGRKTETISNERRWTTAEFRRDNSKSEYTTFSVCNIFVFNINENLMKYSK